MRIALLEDDIDQGRLMSAWIEDAGHRCSHFESYDRFVRELKRHTYDLVVLDWMLPDRSGIEVLHWLRSNFEWRIPVLFVTQRDREEDVVSALSAGADDYMVKPVKHRELLARLEAVGRRTAVTVDPTRSVLEMEPFRIDREHRIVEVEGNAIKLTQKEYELTLFLFNNLGRVVSRSDVLESVWGTNPMLNTRTVDTHISRIRSKLHIPHLPNWRLSAVYQHGYRLERLDSMAETNSPALCSNH